MSFLGIGKKTQRNIKRQVGKTTKSVGTFGRKYGDEVSKVGATVVGAAPAAGVAAPEVAAVGAALVGSGQALKVAGEAEQSIRKARRTSRRRRFR
tara:strand:- start:4655 stop:4939 length:285 start_codon:yes stop_codon:yes gene_type:complete